MSEAMIKITLINPEIPIKIGDRARDIYSIRDGHGHVTPRQDGSFKDCGGPTTCKECQKEYVHTHGIVTMHQCDVEMAFGRMSTTTIQVPEEILERDNVALSV